LALLAVQLLPAPPVIVRAVHLICAVGGVAWAVIAVSIETWGSVVLVGIVGITVGLVPWPWERWLRFDPAALRTRLAFILVLAALVPIVVLFALGAEQAERVAVADAETNEERLALALAAGVERYVGLHQSAVAALAAQPALLTQPADGQRAVLLAFGRAYPDVLAFSIYAAGGAPLARSDEAPLGALPAWLVSELPSHAGRPTVQVGTDLLGPNRSWRSSFPSARRRAHPPDGPWACCKRSV
jgi:hypothetical protein